MALKKGRGRAYSDMELVRVLTKAKTLKEAQRMLNDCSRQYVTRQLKRLELEGLIVRRINMPMAVLRKKAGDHDE